MNRFRIVRANAILSFPCFFACFSFALRTAFRVFWVMEKECTRNHHQRSEKSPAFFEYCKIIQSSIILPYMQWIIRIAENDTLWPFQICPGSALFLRELCFSVVSWKLSEKREKETPDIVSRLPVCLLNFQDLDQVDKWRCDYWILPMRLACSCACTSF